MRNMAYETDTFGLEHEFKTSLGPTITLAGGGDYGWVIGQGRDDRGAGTGHSGRTEYYDRAGISL